MANDRYDIDSIEEHIARDDEAKNAGRSEARALIVRALRAQGGDGRTFTLEEVADAIEHGELS